MSRAKTPTDNPIIEALNGWMKNELYIDFDLENTKDISKLISNKIKNPNSNKRFDTSMLDTIKKASNQ